MFPITQLQKSFQGTTNHASLVYMPAVIQSELRAELFVVDYFG